MLPTAVQPRMAAPSGCPDHLHGQGADFFRLVLFMCGFSTPVFSSFSSGGYSECRPDGGLRRVAVRASRQPLPGTVRCIAAALSRSLSWSCATSCKCKLLFLRRPFGQQFLLELTARQSSIGTQSTLFCRLIDLCSSDSFGCGETQSCRMV